MKALNRYRAMRCGKALRQYDTDFEIEGCLIDFLTDARHWCDRKGLGYADLDGRAHDHYLEEVAQATGRRS